MTKDNNKTERQDASIRLGLCCLNTKLREQKPPVFASRSCIQATAEKKGFDYCLNLAKQNIKDLHEMVLWNRMNNISVFRLSSDIFPHITNQRLDLSNYQVDMCAEELKRFGHYAKKLGQRLTFHPGQFNVLGSPNVDALRTTIYELHVHARMFDLMECNQDSIMVIHGGGVYGDKRATMDRWCKNYQKLPAYIRERIVLENCEKNFSLEDCLEISKRVGVPVVLDNHHFNCYNELHPSNPHKYSIDTYIPDVLDTWQKRGIRPKFHLSEQGTGRTGHHSDLISEIPDYYIEIPRKYNINLDIMIEAKLKEQAILGLYNKYPNLDVFKV